MWDKGEDAAVLRVAGPIALVANLVLQGMVATTAMRLGFAAIVVVAVVCFVGGGFVVIAEEVQNVWAAALQRPNDRTIGDHFEKSSRSTGIRYPVIVEKATQGLLGF